MSTPSGKPSSAALAEMLWPGERLTESWALDCAECDCQATHQHAGVDCISIGAHKERGYQRCLGCGVAWSARWHRWERAAIVVVAPSDEQVRAPGAPACASCGAPISAKATYCGSTCNQRHRRELARAGAR